jgi:2-polyprenyl-3-methyl-5-hydroxy-6-metoxy-1,4-benzoquinol methylase
MNRKVSDYDYEASGYDESRFSDGIGRHLDYVHKKILGSLADSLSKLVLEAGIGTGRFATWLTEKGFEVVGVDISKEMLRKAKMKKEFLNADVGLVLADVHSLPFRTGSFDICICVNVINHLSDVDGFLKQVKCVTRNKGCFIFNFSNVQSLYLPIAIIVNSRNRAFFKRGKIQSRWFTLREIRDMLSRNGFDIEEIKGCFIASPLPWGNRIVKIVRIINFSTENSRLKFFAGSPFVKATLIDHVRHSL